MTPGDPARRLEQTAFDGLRPEQQVEPRDAVDAVERVADEVTIRPGDVIAAATASTGVELRLDGLGDRLESAESPARKVEAALADGDTVTEAIAGVEDRLRSSVVTGTDTAGAGRDRPGADLAVQGVDATTGDAVAGAPTPGRLDGLPGDPPTRDGDVRGPQRDGGARAVQPAEVGGRGVPGTGGRAGLTSAHADELIGLTDPAAGSGTGSSDAAEVPGDPAGPSWRPGEVEAGVPRSTVESDRYLDPGPDVAARLRAAHTPDGPLGDWLSLVNPNFRAFAAGSEESAPWEFNCGDCSRRVADAVQGLAVEPARGDPLLGEFDEMWAWAGVQPVVGFTNPPPAEDDGTSTAGHTDPGAFTAQVWEAIGRALAGEPVGSVAVLGVHWDSPVLTREESGGHFFTAVVTADGLRWVDGQSGETTGWPPGYRTNIWSAQGIVRRPGSTWEGIGYGGSGRSDGRSAGVDRADLGRAVPGPLAGPAIPGRVRGLGADPADRRPGLPGAPRPGASGQPGAPGRRGGLGAAGRPAGLTPEEAAELAGLRRRLTAEAALTRWRARSDAVAFLRAHELVRGVPDLDDGTIRGGSPDVVQRIVRLPRDARADVLAVNELVGLSGVPPEIPGRGAAAAGVALGTGLPAALGQVPAMLLGLLTGDLSRLAVGAAGAAVGLAGALGLGVADRSLTRQAARLATVEQARQGPPAEVRAVLDAARAQLATDLAAVAAEQTGQDVPPQVTGPRPRDLRRLLPTRRHPHGPGVDERRAPVPGPAVDDEQARSLLDGSPPRAEDRLPSYGAWLTRSLAGPSVALVGIGVLAAAAMPFSPVLAATLGVSVVGAFAAAGAARRLAGTRERADIARDAVREARKEALGRAVADLELHRAVVDRDRAARELDDVRAALAGTTASNRVPPTAPPDGRLVPGPADGVLTRDALGVDDLARLTEVESAARPGELRGRDERLRAAVQAAGMAVDPVAVETDPDRAGWPRRRALLTPDVRAAVQALDPVPTGVPGTAAYLGAGLVGTGLPSAAAATVAALVSVGLGPLSLVTIGLGPVALAAAAGVRTRQVLRAEERQKDRRAAATGELAGAAREILDVEVARIDAETAALTAEATDRASRAIAAEHGREALADRVARRTERPLRRLVDRIVGAAEPVVQLPPDPPSALPSTPVAVPEPGPVPAQSPVRTAWLRALGTGVSGPVTVAVGAVAVWQTCYAGRFGSLLDPATWAALDATTSDGAIAVVAALTAGAAVVTTVGAVVADVATTWVTSSQYAAAARREAVLAAHEAYRARALREALLGADHAAVRDLRRAAAERRRVVDSAHLAALRAADAEVPPRPAGLVPRLVGWLAARDDLTVRALLREAPPGGPLHLAALARLAERLPELSPARAAELAPALADSISLARMHPDRPTGHPALDQLVAALHRPDVPVLAPQPADTAARPVSGPRARGIDWAVMVAIANATGWWPEWAADGWPTPPTAPPPLPPLDPPADERPTREQPPPDRPTGAVPAQQRPPAVAPTPQMADPTTGPPRPPHPYPAPPRQPGRGGPVVVEEVWPDGVGSTRAALVTVRSPGGHCLQLLVRWIQAGPGRAPVLLLSELPGSPFWWGAPEALRQAVAAAWDAFDLTPEQRVPAIVLGERQDWRGAVELAQFSLDLGDPDRVRTAGPPRVLPPAEVRAASAALRLRPVEEVLAGLGPLAPTRAGVAGPS